MEDDFSGNFEKSPVDQDYEGLQLDTRALENREKHFDGSKAQGSPDDDFDAREHDLEKEQAHRSITTKEGTNDREELASPDSAYTTCFSPITDDLNKPTIETVETASIKSRQRRICSLRRRHFWGILGLILGVAIAGTVVGIVVGITQARRQKSPQPPPPPPNNTNNQTALPSFVPPKSSDVMEGSPLAVVSYDQGGTGKAEDRQVYRIYYQSLLGNVKEAVYNGTASWQPAVPIFTDALNHTGLATTTYLNGTQQQGSIFYIGENGFVQEKRMIYADVSSYWKTGTLNNLELRAIGDMTLPAHSDGPINDWDSYRMAAVYSKNFQPGPGIRLFYHAQTLNGAGFVQEMVWTQDNDTWSKGVEIFGPWPNSNLAATIDENAGLLRLFYSSGNQTLQESYMSISKPAQGYADGLRLPGYLHDDDSDIAVVSNNGTTYCYHYASGIHELTLNGLPGSVDNQESYNLSELLVSAPALTSNGIQSSYQPLAASKITAFGLTEQLTVFWADQITGNVSTNITGYQGLTQISRDATQLTWPSGGQQQIPLGNQDVQPHS